MLLTHIQALLPPDFKETLGATRARAGNGAARRDGIVFDLV